MSHRNLTDEFINYLYHLSQKEFDKEVITQVKRCFLDYLGVTFAGNIKLEDKLYLLIDQFDRGLKEAPIIGADKRVSCEGAAFINGVCSHVLELDDGVRYGGFHPGAPIFSALIASTGANKIKSKNFIKGVIVGYEAAIRMAAAMQPFHYNRGYHPTGTCGTIGAAVSLAVALGFSKRQLKLAFSNAAVSASGTLKVLEGASELKPMNVGNASLSALIAIYKSLAGFEVPDDVLSGEKGFITMMAGEYDENILLGERNRLAIMNIYFKLFAACRHCHSPIEALLNIITKKEISLESIEEIRVRTYDYVIGKHDHKVIYGPASAKMSIPYSIAVALLYGNAQDEQFSEMIIANPQIQKVVDKVTIVEDRELSDLVPVKRPAIVEIVLKNGKVYHERVDFPKGEPENPLTNRELEDKFMMLMEVTKKSQQDSITIKNYVWNLENNMEELFRLL